MYSVKNSESSGKKHKWIKQDDTEILTNHLLPPWDGIKFDDKEDNTTTLFTPSVVDKQGITSRDIVAQNNWGNYYLQKGVQHLHQRLKDSIKINEGHFEKSCDVNITILSHLRSILMELV